MPIDRVKVRATITIGSLSVSTPFVQSFNVTKTRGQPSSFSASMKVGHDQVSGTITGDNVSIRAGGDGALKQIFTGIVKQAKISPCWDDPYYVILSISGADALSLLQGKKFTRRCRATRSTWVNIQSVVRPGLKSGRFAYVNAPTIEMDDGVVNDQQNLVNTRRTMNYSNITTKKTAETGTKMNVDINIAINPNAIDYGQGGV